jgi:hypothetical protein
LLAYLDDTLEPAQAKVIGQKVNESETARELIARIKQVTRRRRLTTPPVTGAGAKTDAGTIAAYLDNTLPAEQLAEVEEICLASDVHLAEIAACHQILTLVLGEPALVPPTARQRMYGLVKGPEAIPFRKATSPLDTGDAGADLGHEDDETLRMGLPAYRRHGGWSQPLTIIAGGLALVALLAFAIWQLLPPSPRNAAGAGDSKRGPADKDSQARADDGGNQKQPDNHKKKPKTRKPSDRAARDSRRNPKGDDAGNGQGDKTEDGTREGDKPTRDGKAGRDQKDDKSGAGKGRPALAPRVLASFVPPANAVSPVLLRRPRGKDQWERLERNRREVKTGDRLVSLPGYRSTVRFRNGLEALLWGDVWEFNLLTPVLESAVIVNDPEDRDLDLTLDHGRVIISNPDKDKARIRLRFANPTVMSGKDAWEITLQGKGSEVGLELWGRYPPGVSFNKNPKTRLGPQTELYLFVLKGKAQVQIEDTTHAMEAPPEEDEANLPSLVFWNSNYGVSSPRRIKRLPEWGRGEQFSPIPQNLSKQVRSSLQQRRRDMLDALKDLSIAMSGKKVDVILEKEATSNSSIKRVLVVRCFGAINDLPNLLDRLTDEKYPDVRQAAIEVLRHWIGIHKDNALKLHRVLIKDKKYRTREADTVLRLLYSYSEKDLGRPETYSQLIDYLRQEKPAIRILALWHLVAIVPAGRGINIDPMNEDNVGNLYKAWKRQVPEGSLPKVPRGRAKQPSED